MVMVFIVVFVVYVIMNYWLKIKVSFCWLLYFLLKWVVLVVLIGVMAGGCCGSASASEACGEYKTANDP